MDVKKLFNDITNYLVLCSKDSRLKDKNEDDLIYNFLFQQKINNDNLLNSVIELISSDYKYSKDLINLYENKFIKYFQSGLSYEESIRKISISIITRNDTKEKEKFINYDKAILNWLGHIKFFQSLCDNMNIPSVSNDDIIEFQKNKEIIDFTQFRQNQIEAFTLLDKNGLETGIHCQATGCGKSYIILKYIGYTQEKYKNPKIILFTERVNILADLFSFNKNELEPNKENIIKWNKMGLCDLTKFNIINRVTIKKKDWADLLSESDKPTLLVINRAYLTLDKSYEKIKDLTLVLHDECHNTTSIQCNKFLLDCKEKDIPIIGFSATPVRTGKNDVEKLMEIYGKNDNLNLLTDYNMIYSISQNLILPPEFHWYQFETYKQNVNNNELVSQEELGSVLELLNYLIPNLPNKKMIAWCGTIRLANEWKKLFETSYKQRTHLKNLKFGIDTSISNNDDYNNFSKIPKDENGEELEDDELDKSDKRRMYYGNSILFCANKHREGSDIKLLDSCIFLDKVKNRSAIPFIQSIGRVLRTSTNKTKGVVIDGIVKEENNYEKQFVNKIFDYYLALENMSSINSDSKTKYDKYVEIRDIVKFDKDEESIELKLGNKVIKINCNKLDWDEVISKFDEVLQNKIKLSSFDNFTYKAKILKEKFGFNKKTDFINEYKKISDEDKKLYNLPDIDSPDYIILFSKKTWIEFLEIEHNYYSLDELIKLGINKDNYKEKRKKDKRIPKYPQYYYKNFSFSLLGNKKIDKNNT